MPGNQLSDEHLMLMISAGNRDAFETLYDRYFDRLVWFAQTFLKNVAKSEDVVQDIFIKIIEKPLLFEKDRRFSTWVYTITGNACRNVLRNEKNRSRLLTLFRHELDSKQEPAAAQLDNVLVRTSVQGILARLSDKERQIYALRFEAGMGSREISTIMGIPEGSVKSGIFYLLKKMAVQLKHYKYENEQ